MSNETDIERLLADALERAERAEAALDHANALTEKLYTQTDVDAMLFKARHYVNGRCRSCGGREGEHQMSCRLYEGPLEHRWVYHVFNETFNAIDYYCTCGSRRRDFGDGEEMICLNKNLSWRGPI